MRLTQAIAAAVLCFPAFCLADDFDKQSTQADLRHVQIETLPTSAQFLRFYPSKASAERVAGSATIRCLVTESLQLDHCVVLDETPLGYDFGNAAINLSKIFKLKAKTTEGFSVVGGTFKTKIKFQWAAG